MTSDHIIISLLPNPYLDIAIDMHGVNLERDIFPKIDWETLHDEWNTEFKLYSTDSRLPEAAREAWKHPSVIATAIATLNGYMVAQAIDDFFEKKHAENLRLMPRVNLNDGEELLLGLAMTSYYSKACIRFIEALAADPECNLSLSAEQIYGMLVGTVRTVLGSQLMAIAPSVNMFDPAIKGDPKRFAAYIDREFSPQDATLLRAFRIADGLDPDDVLAGKARQIIIERV